MTLLSDGLFEPKKLVYKLSLNLAIPYEVIARVESCFYLARIGKFLSCLAVRISHMFEGIKMYARRLRRCETKQLWLRHL